MYPAAEVLDCGEEQRRRQQSVARAHASAKVEGPSVEERALLFLKAQDRVKKRPLFKIGTQPADLKLETRRTR
ncbi:hypothetical protein Tco_0071846, partial [Tanacetum coccineum]